MAIDARLVQNATLAADEVALSPEFQSLTGAAKTRALVERALEALEANGLITVTPEADRPFFFAPFPPYNRIIESERDPADCV